MSSTRAISKSQRIAVVGSPGAGKTTFSRTLAEKTGLPLVHLDFYYHDRIKNYQSTKNKQAWFAKVRELIRPDEWIIDGNYSSTFPLRFKRADTIIFLDYPRRISFSRTLKRTIKSRWVERGDMPKDWKDTLNLEFLKFVWFYNSRHRRKVTDRIDVDLSKKVIVLRHPRETKRFLDNL